MRLDAQAKSPNKSQVQIEANAEVETVQQTTNVEVTRTRTRSGMGQNTRFDASQRQGTGDLGPGAYERKDGIGTSGKGLGFGKPKAEKKVVDNRDYGYQEEKSFTQIR